MPVPQPRPSNRGRSTDAQPPIPQPRPADRTATPTSAAQFAVPLSDDATLPTTPAGAPLSPTVSLAPTRAFDAKIDIGSVVAGVATGTVDARIDARTGGKVGPLTIPNGLRTSIHGEIEAGTLSGGRVDFSGSNGQPRSLSALGGLLGVRNLTIDDNKLLAQTEIFGGLKFIRVNATSNVFQGHSTIPVDPHELVSSLGLGQNVAIAGPGAGTLSRSAQNALNIFDLQGAVIRADLQLAATNGKMVNFGDGVALSIRPGSTVKLERANGRNVYDLQVNVDKARFGRPDGSNVTIGPASLHLLAEERLIDGKSHWTVRMAQRSTIEDVRINIPAAGGVTNELQLGAVSASASGNQPIIAMEGTQLNVNLDGRLERMQGALNLRDTSGRVAQLELGSNGARTTVRTHIEFQGDISASKPPSRVLISGATEGLRVAIRAPNGLQVASGEGLSFGVGEGTQLSGGGRFTYEQSPGNAGNFTIESREGISADLVLNDTSIARRLGDLGARINLGDGSRVAAQVRKMDWASGVADVSVSADARIDQARFTVATGENATITNANAKANLDLRWNGRETTPTIRGNLRVESQATPGLASTQISFLPNVPGFDDNGRGGVTMKWAADQTVAPTPSAGSEALRNASPQSTGRVVVDIPVSFDENGFRTVNGSAQHATVQGDGLDIQTTFDTAGVASGEVTLPELAPDGALDAAAVRHNERMARITRDPIPALTPLPAVSATAVDLKPLESQLLAPSVIMSALRDVDADITTRTPATEFTKRIYNGPIAESMGNPQTGFGGFINRTFSGLTNAYKMDLTFAPNTQIRMRLDSEHGSIVSASSGFTFDPPVRLKINQDANNWQWVNDMQSDIEITGLRVAQAADKSGRIELQPVLGRTTGLEGRMLNLIGGDTWFAQKVAQGLVQKLTGASTMPQNTAQLAAAFSPLMQQAVSGKPSQARGNTPDDQFTRAIENNLRFKATGTLGSATIPLPSNNRLTFKHGNNVSVSNMSGAMQISGDVALGETRLNIGRDELALNSGRARFSATLRDGRATYAFTNLSADGLNISALNPNGRLVVRDGALHQGDITLNAEGERLTYQGNLDTISATQVEVTQKNGAYMRLSGGATGGRARVDRLTFQPTGSVTVRGLNGRLAANGYVGESRYFVQRADVTNGSLNLSPTGALTTSPLALSNVRMAVTNVNVPPGGPSAPGAIAAHITRLDARARDATLRISPSIGYSLTTPEGRPADVVVSSDAATFRLPSPQVVVNVSNATASGALESLQLNPNAKKENIAIRGWYMEGDATGTIVAGPAGSQASRVAIEPGARVATYVENLAFTHDQATQHIETTAQVKLVTKLTLPPPAAGADIRAGGSANGIFEFNVSTRGKEVHARSRARIDELRAQVDVQQTVGAATEAVQSTTRSVVEKFRAGTPLPSESKPAAPQRLPTPPQRTPQLPTSDAPIPMARPAGR